MERSPVIVPDNLCNVLFGIEPPPGETLYNIDGGWGPNSEVDPNTDLEAAEPSYPD